MTKSGAAFLISAEILFEMSDEVYFWTLTFRHVHCDWQYASLFAPFIRELRDAMNRKHLDLKGLRVIEPHREHGLHYHLLLNQRIPVDIVRRIGKKYDMGRIYVVKCNEKAADYLAKYLTKKSKPLFGPRRWWRIGTWDHCTKNRLVCDTPYHRNMRLLFDGKQAPFEYAQEVMAFSMTWGDVVEWPFEYVAKNTVIEYLLEQAGIPF